MQTKLVYVFIISITLFLPSLVSASVIINEIAWMGTTENWRYEWLELYNDGSQNVTLDNWKIELSRTELDFTINPQGIIPVAGYFLIVSSESIFSNYDYNYANLGGKFVNTGQKVVLRDASGNIVDSVDGSDNWKIGGGEIIGNNTTKKTAQRSGSLWINCHWNAQSAECVSAVQGGSAFLRRQQQPPSQPSSGGSDSSPYIPPENLPKIKAYAGEDKTVIVGANAEFRGQAFGLKDEPLDNARYLWTFGDGTSKEGQNITHFYQYLGRLHRCVKCFLRQICGLGFAFGKSRAE